METLFVYGTLCFPEIIEKLTGKTFVMEPAVLKGFRRRRVKGADYPAIVVDSGSEVEGILWKDIDQRSLEIVLFYEGGDYRMEKLNVVCNGTLVKANVFIWISDVTVLENEDWNREQFVKNSLPVYLNEVIPDTVTEFDLNSKI